MEKHPVFRAKLTVRQRAADKVSLWFGSWKFISLVFIFIAIWAVINVYMILYRWDPYPFILLNFILSTLAAIQAPIILMSQGRQAERDRINAKYDYQVTRKTEREIQNMQQDLDEIKFLIKNLKE